MVDEGRFRLKVDSLLLKLFLTRHSVSRRSIDVEECLVLLVVVMGQVVLVATTLWHHMVQLQACRWVALWDARLLRNFLVDVFLEMTRVFIGRVRDVRIIWRVTANHACRHVYGFPLDHSLRHFIDDLGRILPLIRRHGRLSLRRLDRLSKGHLKWREGRLLLEAQLFLLLFVRLEQHFVSAAVLLHEYKVLFFLCQDLFWYFLVLSFMKS